MTEQLASVNVLLHFNIDPENAAVHHVLVDEQGKVIEASYDGHEIQRASEEMQEEVEHEVQWYSLVVSADEDIEATVDRHYNEFLKVDAEPFMDGDCNLVSPDMLLNAIIVTTET